jgi:HAD superfamily hydrolase (TIGR01549 family)
MKYRIVIFDFDGTTADSFASFLIILNRLAQEFQFKAVAPEEIEAFQRKTSQEVTHSLEIPFFKLPFVLQRARKEFREMMPVIPIIPGMKETLFGMQTHEVQLGLLSSNGQENIQDFLRRNRLDCFDVILSSSGLWSKARRLDKMVRAFGVEREKVLYVGDETRDIEAARKVAAVSWGYNNAEILREFSPDYLFENPQELLFCIKDCH